MVIKLFLIGLGLLLLSGMQVQQPSSYIVCAQGCPYHSIQQAIDQSAAGETVTIGPGVYKENLSIDKNLRLIGTGQDQVQVQAIDDQKAVISVVSKSPIQIFLQGITLGDPTFRLAQQQVAPPRSNRSTTFPAYRTGLFISGVVQATLRQITITGLNTGLFATRFVYSDMDSFALSFKLQLTLDEVQLVKNQLALSLNETDGVIFNSRIAENLIGIMGESIFLYHSEVRGNQLIGIQLQAPELGPNFLGELQDDVITENGIGVYITAMFDTAKDSWIRISNNHFLQNKLYGIVLKDQVCPGGIQLPTPPSVFPNNRLEVRILGGIIEFKDNGKGNICPNDYSLPQGFIK